MSYIVIHFLHMGEILEIIWFIHLKYLKIKLRSDSSHSLSFREPDQMYMFTAGAEDVDAELRNQALWGLCLAATPLRWTSTRCSRTGPPLQTTWWADRKRRRWSARKGRANCQAKEKEQMPKELPLWGEKGLVKASGNFSYLFVFQ